MPIVFVNPPIQYDPQFANVEYLFSCSSLAAAEESSNAWLLSYGNAPLPSIDSTNTLFGQDTMIIVSGNRQHVRPAHTPTDLFHNGVDITVEAWIRYDGSTSNGMVACCWRSQSGAFYRWWQLSVQADAQSNALLYRVFDDVADVTRVTCDGPSVPQDGSWTHVVAMRDGDDHVCFVNGVPSNVVNTTDRENAPQDTGILFGENESGNEEFKGNFSEQRVSLEAVYPLGGFTPPRAPFPRS